MELDYSLYTDVDIVNREEFNYTYKGFNVVDYKAKLYSKYRVELEQKRVEYLYTKSQISYELYMCLKSKMQTVKVCVEMENCGLVGVLDSIYDLYRSRLVGSFESEYIYKVYVLFQSIELRLKNNHLNASEIYSKVSEKTREYILGNTDKEWVYVASNDPILHTGAYKIGMSVRDPLERLAELSNTSVVYGFYPHLVLPVHDSLSLEQELHRVFRGCRLVRSREYFKLGIPELLEYLRDTRGLSGTYYV